MDNLNQITLLNNVNQFNAQFNIDSQLMQDAIKVSGTDQKSTIEAGLKLLVQLSHQQEIRNLRGKLPWDGDLDDMRSYHAI